MEPEALEDPLLAGLTLVAPSAPVASLDNERATLETQYKPSQAKDAIVDMTAHAGIRGLAAVLIVIHHLFYHSKLQLSLGGSIVMPVFFLLSGFSLSVVYGRKTLRVEGCTTALWSGQASDKALEEEEAGARDPTAADPAINYWSFYRGRIARVMPVYWLCLLLAIPVDLFAGQGGVDPHHDVGWALLTNFIPTVTWLPQAGLFNGPSWTISTLIFFWIFFPFLLPRYQRLSDKALCTGIVAMFWLQLGLLTGLYVVIRHVFPDDGGYVAFTMSSMTPYSRFPVFSMGMQAGLLAQRGTAAMYWPKTAVFFFPLIAQDRTAGASLADVLSWWRRKVQRSSAVLLLSFVLALAVDLTVKSTGLLPNGIHDEVWLQALMPFAVLNVLVGLTQEPESGRSGINEFCRRKGTQFLGAISMSLYLVHYPLFGWFNYLVYGINTHPNGDCTSGSAREIAKCAEDWSRYWRRKLHPVWGIAVLAPLAVSAACFLHYAVEEPARKRLKRTTKSR